MRTRSLAGALALAALAFTGAACQSGHGAAAKSKAEALASSTPNAQAVNTAKADVTRCVNATPTAKLVTKAGRKQVETCVDKILTPTQKTALEDCLLHSAVADHVLTRKGREAFESRDAGACVDRVTAR